LNRAVELGIVDAIIAPQDTRRMIAQVLASVPRQRGDHSNIPL
jgi:acetyl-CoA/propionyl-CoA carboxylase carboxyl transferase subunit